MPMYSRKHLLTAKIETTYGQDANPTPASNAILAENLKVKPTYDIIERTNVALPDLSLLKHLVGRYWAELTFDVEIRGSGDTDGDTPPDFGCLLQACSMKQTITGAPNGDVTYTPASTDQKSVTIYANLDGVLHKFVGCVGNVVFSGEVGKPIGRMSFAFRGKLLSISDTALTAPTYQNLTPPLILGATMTYGAWSPPISRFSIDLKNVIAERPDIHEASGIMGFFISGRAPEGQFDPEAVSIATRNVWNNLATANEAALNIVIGSAAGNKCTITASKCVKKEIAWGDRNGILTYDIVFGLYRNTGDDEISIKFQ